jgi:hypothetical protein
MLETTWTNETRVMNAVWYDEKLIPGSVEDCSSLFFFFFAEAKHCVTAAESRVAILLRRPSSFFSSGSVGRRAASFAFFDIK